MTQVGRDGVLEARSGVQFHGELGQDKTEDVGRKIVGTKGNQTCRQLGTGTGEVKVQSAKGELGHDLLQVSDEALVT